MLEKIQKQTTKWILNEYQSSYSCHLMSLHLLPLIYITSVKKIENFKRGTGITEKSDETMKLGWYVNHKSLFWLCMTLMPRLLTAAQSWCFICWMAASWCFLNDHRVKIGICSLHYHPSDPFLFHGFFQWSLFPFWNFQFFITLVYILLYPFMDYAQSRDDSHVFNKFLNIYTSWSKKCLTKMRKILQERMTRILKDQGEWLSMKIVWLLVWLFTQEYFYRQFTSKNILTALLSMCHISVESWHSITSCDHHEEQLPTHLEHKLHHHVSKEVHGNHIGWLLTVCG